MHYLTSHLLMLCVNYRLTVGENQEVGDGIDIRSCCPQDNAEQILGIAQMCWYILSHRVTMSSPTVTLPEIAPAVSIPVLVSFNTMSLGRQALRRPCCALRWRRSWQRASFTAQVS